MPIVARFTTRLGKVYFKRKSYIEVHGSTSLTMLTRLNSTLHSRVISNIAVLKKKKNFVTVEDFIRLRRFMNREKSTYFNFT